MSLTLRATDVAGPTRWRWLLVDTNTGRSLADHQVKLDPHATEYEAFTDLAGYLRRNRLPDDRIGSETAIVSRISRWIGEQVLGAGLGRLLTGTVRVVVPPEADFLLTRPLELAEVEGRPLARRGVSLVFELPGGEPPVAHGRQPVGETLRILALFSLPSRHAVLALRRERYELTRTVREIASRSRKAIELRVLQYGVTRERLAETVEEYPGWDILHVSGHGALGTLALEQADGSPDEISTAELVELLRPARERLKLAVLAACSSGADVAASTLRMLNLDAAADQVEEAGGSGQGGEAGATDQVEEVGETAGDRPEQTVAVGLARGLVEQLGVAVLAMRYPVADTFAVELSRELYPRLLGAGQPVDRATAIALPRAAGQTPSLVRPPLSIGIPALFGATAVGLRVAPPSGEATLDPYAERMAGFPDEPERFVGRTPALIAASGALAPRSGRSGVLFLGMAGAGKTSCALELAHQHRDRFQRLAWWQAPSQPDAFGQALSSLAYAVESQLGIPMVHAVGSETELRRYLPRLRTLLRDNALLLVLDNLETLLSESRTWRDPNWTPLVETLLGHGGLSRVVLTSRVVPAGLDGTDRLLRLPTHALTLAESVLLARELPHLGRLLHEEPVPDRSAAEVAADRELARRVLDVVQGHPKLLELADAAAADPAGLAVRLAATEAAGRDTPMAAFFCTGTSELGGDEYVDLLGAWTRSVLADLPPPARGLAELLALVEDDDRWSYVVESVWASLWERRHGGEAASLDEAVAVLTDAAMVAAESSDPESAEDSESSVSYRLHPGVAEAMRADADPELRVVVDDLLATFWERVCGQAMRMERRGEEASSLVVRAGLAATPYLLRQGRWSTAIYFVEQVGMRDESPATSRRLLGFSAEILAGEADPDQRRRHELVFAKLLVGVDPPAARVLLQRAVGAARAAGDFEAGSVAAGDLANLLRDSGDLTAALSAVAEQTELTRLAGLGPWTRASDEGHRLQLLSLSGRYQEVLDQIEELLTRLDTLPVEPDRAERVHPFNVREATLDVAFDAACGLADWEGALAFHRRRLDSMRARGADPYHLARMAFNGYGPLSRLRRFAEAEELLLHCMAIFEAVDDIYRLGVVAAARADLEDARGRAGEAVARSQTALRLLYQRPEPGHLAVSHFNLANYLSRAAGQSPADVVAHRLAAALLEGASGRSGGYQESVTWLAQELAEYGEAMLPGDLTELTARVEDVPGVRFGAVLAALISEPERREMLFAEMIEAVRRYPVEDRIAPHLERWAPHIPVVVGAARGNEEAVQTLRPFLDNLAATRDWAALVAVVRRIIEGERDEGPLLDGLDRIDTAIVRAILTELHGGSPKAPGALAEPPQASPAHDEGPAGASG
ncbi:CHAT domain-containing protein [Plantactinospora sp. B5E13]|uniref:CHAT domain-containing protein n=1 Tax=Plantactinospora sp. B5E13 TaxID=3153758 RepID=UPI00325DA55C